MRNAASHQHALSRWGEDPPRSRNSGPGGLDGLAAPVLLGRTQRNPAPGVHLFRPLDRAALTAVPPELIGRIAPTHAEGINQRGVFSFPIEQYAERLLPLEGEASTRTTQRRTRSPSFGSVPSKNPRT